MTFFKKITTKILNACLPLGILAIIYTLISQSSTTATAITATMNVWWQNVVPALLPFFILSELMQKLGIMKALSIWLEPLMQPLFRLNGAAAMAVLMGFVAGSPTGAAITANLRRNNLITKNEGNRLLAFSANTGMMYILIAVAGVLGNPKLGFYLLLAHYPLNLIFGIALRFFPDKKNIPQTNSQNSNCFKTGLQALITTPKEPLAQILRTSCHKSLENIAIIGGFMLIFTLIIATLENFHIFQIQSLLFAPLCQILNLDPNLATALAKGFWEMTLGIAEIGNITAATLDKTAVAAMIISWNGLCIQCQIAGIIADTDLSLKYYIPTRICHAICSALIILNLQPTLAVSTFTSQSNLIYYLINPLLQIAAVLIITIILSIFAILLSRKP